MREPQYFDAETISMMKSGFDETCAAVPEGHLTQSMRLSIERDRIRLRNRTLMEVYGVPRPAVILVNDGDARVIRFREGVEDLLRYETDTLDS